MSARRDNADGPEDIDAAFAEIVAGLEQDEQLARWPDEESARLDEPEPDAPEPPESGPRDWAPVEEDEGHYEPPEPPPMPRPSAAAVGGIALILIGVLLLLVPGLAGLGGSVALGVGLITVSIGIGWLLLRLRRSPPDDDGARL